MLSELWFRKHARIYYYLLCFLYKLIKNYQPRTFLGNFFKNQLHQFKLLSTFPGSPYNYLWICRNFNIFSKSLPNLYAVDSSSTFGVPSIKAPPPPGENLDKAFPVNDNKPFILIRGKKWIKILMNNANCLIFPNSENGVER